jgi:succinate dehydrogenase / fumarate reductase, cytochrome b subunit
VNAIQIAFSAGLVLVLAAVSVFSAVVLRSAARGGRAAGFGLLNGRSDFGELGRVAFIAHRLTGFAIFAFLSLHILDVGLYSVSPALYDDVQHLYGTAPLRVFECGLLFAILFHTGNGLRLLAVDLFTTSAARARQLLWAVIATAAAAGTLGSALILAPIF